MFLNELAKVIHENNVKHGWSDNEKSFGDECALIHSEISEAFKEHRNGHAVDKTYYSCNHGDFCDGGLDCDNCKNHKPEGIPSELIDIIIRTLGLMYEKGIDIDEILKIKMQYNMTREYKHGGKKL